MYIIIAIILASLIVALASHTFRQIRDLKAAIIEYDLNEPETEVLTKSLILKSCTFGYYVSIISMILAVLGTWGILTWVN